MIRALVIDDSAYNRVTITRMLESHPDIKVIGTAVDGEDGIKQLLRLKPDVITLDLEMPVMDGFAFLRWLMVNQPTPVIAVSSQSSDRSVFKALELGALDFIAKPGGRVSVRLSEIEKDLAAKVLQVVDVRLDNLTRRVREEETKHAEEVSDFENYAGRFELIVIGSSTGGPPALQQVFESLPRLPVACVVAQHMPPTFTRLFAERLNRLSAFEVKEAEDGDAVKVGCVYVAPGGSRTEVRRGSEGLILRVMPPKPEDLYAPSVDRLFESASDACGERLIAVVLTGMGDDGARALPALHSRGARTIAESAETAIISGMPSSAVRTGAVDEVLPLGEIASAIHRLCLTGS
ncbi:MAG TPA: chemotaxis response regulator protein-glutamate methylesterase [Thermoanaerobaculia bacterium]|nr:chemotaxis response regulator protein-glutamate methylesterase [Thermoanaerobaculia bacterium]